MHTNFQIRPAETEEQLQEIATLAKEIWHQHFTPIIGEDQVTYMVEKFQSYPALKRQIEQEGYEYFRIYSNDFLAGYTGIRPDTDSLFLSKLYLHQDFRGQHLASQTFRHLVNLCKERGMKKIWLTCNKHNDNTLKVYDHLGFKITDTQVADIGNGFVMDDYIMTYEILK